MDVAIAVATPAALPVATLTPETAARLAAERTGRWYAPKAAHCPARRTCARTSRCRCCRG